MHSPQPVNAKIYIKLINSEEFTLSADERDVALYDYSSDQVISKNNTFSITGRFKFGEKITGPNYSFRVLLNNQYENYYTDKDIYFSFNNINSLTAQYKNALEIAPANLEATIVDISFKGLNIKKSIDFINGLTGAYLQRNLNKKNYLAISTIEYIDRQLADISDSLLYSGQELQDFRRRYQVMDIEIKAGRVYAQLQDLEDQKTELVRNLRFYQSLDQHFELYKDSSSIRAPSVMGINDALLNTQIQELATLNSEKNSLIRSNQLRSPRLQTLNVRIEDLKNTISENVKFIISSTQLTLNEINEDIALARYEETKLPQTQRKLLEIERMFNLNDAVYTFLLQKRAEAQIARASNLPDSEIIEPAGFAGVASPKKMMIMALALFLGVAFPGGFLFLRNFFNDKINDIEDLKNLTGIPVIGQILHNDTKNNNVLINVPATPIAESFRTIRAKLQFFSGEESNKVILITSTFSQEGKSFTALNIASSLALFNKKIVIIDCDLRKPSILHKEFGTVDLVGLSLYLSGKAELQEIVIETPIENLDIITSGPIPPNPSELIASSLVHDMIEDLKEKYDYIILDTPPLNPFADVYHLLKLSDINMYIARQNFTPQKIFKMTVRELENNNGKNNCIILNDVRIGKKQDIYKYGYNYYKKDNKSNFFSNIFSRKNS